MQKHAQEKLFKLEGEKVTLMQWLYQFSSIAANIKNNDK